MKLRTVFQIFDTKQSQATIRSWASKAGYAEEDVAELIKYVEDEFSQTNAQLVAARWILAYDGITLDQIKQALYICQQKKIDPLKVNPLELIKDNPDVKAKERPLNPDDVLTDRKEDGDGNVTYVARDEDRDVLRQIINTHYGKDASPWCVLAGDGDGNLSEDSWQYWEHYDAYPKRVAFRDGKLLAFSAGNNPRVREWWDRFDRSFPFIPYIGKQWVGRNGATYEVGKKGNVYRTTKNTRALLKKNYSEDIESTDPSASVDTEDRTIWYHNDWYSYTMEGDHYKVEDVSPNTGNKFIVRFNKDLELDGDYVWYLGNSSQIFGKGQYKNGERTGEWTKYSVDGKVEAVTHYKDGKRHGSYIDYFRNGNVSEEGTYKNDKKDGVWIEYDSDGTVTKKYTYKDDKYNGLCERWYAGQPAFRCYYKDGKKDGVCEKYANGKMTESYTYKDGRQCGPFVEYWGNGQVHLKGTYKDNDALDGKYESFYDNGKPEIISNYKDGKADGKRESFYENGQLKSVAFFKDGKIVGDYLAYFENGQIQQEGHLVNGERTGVWRFYNPDGSLKSEVDVDAEAEAKHKSAKEDNEPESLD